MKSIKPGRGPSMMGGIASVGMGLFGLLWIFFVLRMGGGFFALFGLVFVLIAVAQAVYNFKNATERIGIPPLISPTAGRNRIP